MKTDELIKALERPSFLICDRCQHEDNCRSQGCAIMREAAVRLNLYEHALEQVAGERDRMGKDLKQMEKDMRVLVAGSADPCGMCAHCCEAGKPIFRPNEEYMAYCDKCDEDCSEFVWRGHDER